MMFNAIGYNLLNLLGKVNKKLPGGSFGEKSRTYEEMATK